MKRNMFIAIAVAALMLATTLAQAADVSFSGQFRPRFESNEDSDGATSTRPAFHTRVRLNAKANVNANTEVFLQFQSVGVWGNAQANGNDRASTIGSDDLHDVGFHQAYVTLKGVGGHAVDAKIGRQEVVLDGHRLFGHTGWTTGSQTNDAIRLNHSAGNHSLNYIYIASNEAGGEATADDLNYDIHIFRASTQGVMGGDLTGYFVINKDEMAVAATNDDNTWFTLGARQKGKVSGLDYRVEYYHQFGDGAVAATAQDWSDAYDGVTGSTAINTSDIDRDAYMFGIRVGKTFKNAKYSPTITLWYDILSGQNDSAAEGSEMSQFNTQQDTGHKFYGFMDQFTGATNSGTASLGLQDIALKTKWKLSDKNIFKADFHQFITDTDLDSGDSDNIRSTLAGAFATAEAGAGAGLSDDLGQEIDLTLVHKYDANTKLVAGYSHYFTTYTLGFLNAAGGTIGRTAMDDQDWWYVMLDTKF